MKRRSSPDLSPDLSPQALHQRVWAIISPLRCALALALLCAPHTPLTRSLARAQAPEVQAQERPQERPPIERISEHEIKVGDVLINRQSGRVEVPAEVNLTSGILEYYGVCSEGKLHESVLKINATPSHIHLALILAGYEASQYGKPDPKSYTRPLIKRGSLLRLYIRWRPVGFEREQWVPASAWLYDRKRESAPDPHPYTFEGSIIEERGYAADIERSVIGLIDDPSVVLAPTVDQGNPYQGERLGFEVYSSAIPPKGTPVTLVLQGANQSEIREIERYEEELKEIAELRRKQLAAREALRAVPSPPPFEVQLDLTARSELKYLEP